MNPTNQDKTQFDALLSQNKFAEAFNYAKDIADKEVPWAQYEVGNMYLLGQGVEKNDMMGIFYLGEAADYGNYAPAHYVIGKLYLHGAGLTQDIRRAAWYMGKASAANYRDSRDIFLKTLELINQNRIDGKQFLRNLIFNTSNKNSITWTNLAKNCGLSKNCIKGLAFLFGCANHFSENNAEESLKKINWFMPLPSPDEMTQHFNHVESDQALHYIFEEFAYKTGLEFDPERLNIDGKKATLFNPQDHNLLNEFPGLDNYFNNLRDAHVFFEDMLEKMGSYLYEDEDYYCQTAYLQSCSYISAAFQNDATGTSGTIKTIVDFLPPIFKGLISLNNAESNLTPETEGGTTPFQLAYRALLDSKHLQMCELLWNCQRHAFYEQSTHNLINKEKIFLSSEAFFEFAFEDAKKMIASGYLENTNAKTVIDNSFLLTNSDTAIEEFIWNKNFKQSQFKATDKLSSSAQLQMNACLFKTVFSTLIKNIAWDKNELGDIRCEESTGTIWKAPEVLNLMEFAIEKVPMISSWSTGNQIIIFTLKKSSAKFFVADISENMDEFNELTIKDLELEKPDELIFFFSNDHDFFQNPEMAPANSMKAIFTHYRQAIEPEMKIIICGERNDKRLVYDFQFEKVPLSKTHFESELNSNPIIQSYLKLK